MEQHEQKKKKNWLLVLIYTIMILLCFGIVMVVDHLDTSDRDRKETSGSPYEESPDSPGQEESTDNKDDTASETEAGGGMREPESKKEIRKKKAG